MLSFFSRNAAKKKPRRDANRRGRRCLSLSLEPLEHRQLLSVTAMADSETILGDSGSVAVEVLANDIDTVDTRVQSISAANFTVDSSSAWSVTETGASPNNLTTTTTNTGDVEIQLDGSAIAYDSGVVLATARENETSGYRVIESYSGSSGTQTWLSIQMQSANTEVDVEFGAAYFSFADGWIAGHVDGSGTLVSGNGVTDTDIVQTGSGLYEMSIPGVTDSETEGYLFVLGGSNEDNFASSRALGGDTWEVSVRDNTADLVYGEDDDWSFVYIPSSAPNLIAASVNSAYDNVTNPVYDSVGDFTLVKESDGQWRLTITGADPTEGMLLLNNTATGTMAGAEVPEDNFFSYQADGDDFIIQIRDQAGGQLEDADFQFAFIPFDDATMETPQPTTTLSVASVDAVTGPSGLALSINADNTISIDTSSVVDGTLTGTLTETFTYTVTDGTNTDTATVTVTVVPVPSIEQQIPDQVFSENDTVTIDLTTIFAHSTDTLTYTTSDSDIVEVTFNGDSMELASKNDSFGYDYITLTATDTAGQSASMTFEVNILPDVTDTDGPISGEDTAETVTFQSVDIDVLSNDYHPNGVAYDVAAANVDVPVGATSNAASVWTIAETGSGENEMVVYSAGNVGDVEIGLVSGDLYLSTGVLLGTVRDNTSPYITVDPYNAWSSYGFSTSAGSDSGERSAPIAAAFFSFAEGWVSGQVSSAGVLTNGVGVAPSNITRIQNGLFTVEIPGVTDATADGFLFGACVGNDDNAYSVVPVSGTNTWQYRQTDNDSDGFENDAWSFVYISADTPDLIAGRFDPATDTLLQEVESGGTYTLVQEDVGVYRLTIDGVTPTDGALMLSATGSDATEDYPDNVVTSYVADGDDFLIYTRQTGDFALVDAEFQFVYTPFEDALTLSGDVSFDITAFDATSVAGATVTQNADGTFNYDPSTSTSLQALAFGTSTTDTFTYTLTDANGNSTTSTVTVTVRAPEVDAVDDTVSLSDDASINVTANDTFGPFPSLSVSAFNVAINYDSVSQGDNQADAYIALDSEGNQQRTTGAGTIIINESTDNWGDIDLYLDTNGDGLVEADGVVDPRLTGNDGVVIATINENRSEIQMQGGAASVEAVTESGNMWLATSSITAGDEEAVGVSAAFFSFDDGWIGGHYDVDTGTWGVVNGDPVNGDPTVTQTATGRWIVSIPGVTDSTSEGMLFVIGGSNEDNVASALPLGGDSWEIALRDNAAVTSGGENDDWSFVYVPASATGLIGGQVIGDSTVANPMRFSIGEFTIQQEETGQWRLSVDGYSADEGMLILQSSDSSSSEADQVSFTYEVDGDDFIIQQHQLPTPDVLVDLDFNFLFIPYDNSISQDTEDMPVVVNQVGTSADPTSGVSELGVPLTINADNTISYDTSGALKALAEGETATDTFVYQIADSTGETTDTAVVTVEWVGVNDAPEVVASLSDLVFNEDDPMVSVDLTGLVTDVDTGDSFTYSFDNPDPDLVSLVINGDSLEVTPVADAFGFVQVSVIATDTAGATASTTLNISVMPTLGDDAPTAVDDTAETLIDATVVIQAIGNDIHPDGLVSDVAAAAIDVPGGADDAGSTWTVVGTGSYPNTIDILTQPNAADVGVGLNGATLLPSDGVLLGTSRDNESPYSSVQQWYWEEYETLAFGTQTALEGESAERSGSLAAAYFAFDDGWTAARADSSGAMEAGSGITPADITQTATGVYEVTVPGVTDAATEGYLFSIGTTNNYDITPSTEAQSSTGTWTITQTYNDDGTAVDNSFSFVYIPNDTANLIAGRVASDGTLDSTLQAGGATVVKDEGTTGTYRITLPDGLTSDDGVLLLNSSGSSTIALSYVADGDDFLVSARSIPDFALADAQFDFVFVSYETPLTPNPAASLTVTAFDATSTLGASVVHNGDGTFTYDPTGLTVTPGSTVTDTFTYTIEDGNGNSSTATVTVTVDSPGSDTVDDNFSLAVDSSALNVLANDTLGGETAQTVSAINVEINYDQVDQGNNQADSYIAVDSEGNQEKSTGAGTLTINEAQDNWGDINLYIDVNGDGSVLETLYGTEGVVLSTITENRTEIADQGGYASVEAYTEGGLNMWLATASITAGDEEAIGVSAAYFSFEEGWIGGHYDEATGTFAVVSGDPVAGDPTVTQTDTGRWTITIPGVTDSTTEGMVFVIGGSNEDNWASAIPLGGDSWEIALRDNAATTSGGENDDWSFVYIPRNATGLIGGQVIGDGTAANSLRVSVGDFTIDRQDTGEYILSIDGYTPEDGMLILQSSDADSTTAEHVLLSYEAAENGTDFVIQQHQLPTPDTLVDLDFNFLFIPFDNAISLETPLTVDQLGTSADPTSGFSELGASLSLNADGTVQYDAGDLVAALAEGETLVDTFVYQATDGTSSDTSTATVTLVGVNDAPELVNLIADQTMTEDDPALTISLASVFTDIDNGDTITLTIENGRPDLATAELVAPDNVDLVITPVADAFGSVIPITVTATDSAGAQTSTTFYVTIYSAVDGPTAVADAGETDSGTSITVSVLDNDYHADEGAYELAAANIYSDSTATDNAGSTWTVEQTTSPAITVQSSPNLGDVQIGIDGQDLYPVDGVLLATVRETTSPYATVNASEAFGSYSLSTDLGIGDGEHNSSVATALFPFADGWVSGHVLADGTLAAGVDVSPSDVTKLGTGWYEIDIPGVTDSYSEGFLFAISAANADYAYAASPMGGSTWQFRQLDNDDDATGFVDSDWSFVYLPADLDGLVAGRYTQYEEGGSLEQSVGSFTLTPNATLGEYTLSIPGVTPEDGILLLISTGTEYVASVGEEIPDNRVLSYTASGSDFIISGLSTETFDAINTSFAFAFIPFESTLKVNDYAAYSIVSFDATSVAGATITDNGDGTFGYDPSTSTTIQALASGETYEDTFTYTLEDGNGAQSVGTVTVTVTGEADLDYGDAPESYATLLASDGARHVATGPTLGTARDTEFDGQPSTLADGDDTNGTADEDGIVGASAFAPGMAVAWVEVVVSADSYVNAWIDFNADGTWDASEQLATDLMLTAGTNHVTFAVPATAVPGITYARLRLTSHDTGGTLLPTGLAQDGEVEDYIVQIDDELYLYGTEDDDTVVVRTDGSDYTVTINGVADVYSMATYSSIVLDGAGGTDSLEIYDWTGDDTFAVDPTQATMDWGSDGVDFTGLGFETAKGFALYGGTDEATLTGTTGADKFYGKATQAYIYDAAGTDYRYTASGFETATGVSGGGDDTAYLYGSTGDDALDVTVGAATMTRAGSTTSVATDFANVNGYGVAGGTDVATVTGTTGTDLFTAKETYAYMRNVGGSDYLLYVTSFGEVTGYGDADDTAYLYGAATDDTLEMNVASATMTRSGSTTSAASGFGAVNGYAGAGGTDTATMTGSTGTDLFSATEDYGYIRNVGGTTDYFLYAASFSEVTANGNGGVDDVAYLYGSSSDDSLELSPSSSSMIRSGLSTSVANDFANAYGYAGAGGTDTVTLTGTSGEDRFYGRETLAYMRNVGGSDYFLYARDFGEMTANAGGGSDDVAYLWGSTGDDTLDMAAALSTMTRSGSTTTAVGDFATVYGLATTGGTDTANLVGTTGDDVFYSRPAYSILRDAASAVYQLYAGGFSTVEAHGNGGADDIAYLYGSTGSDTLDLTVGSSTMTRAGSSTAVATDFANVNGYAVAGGTDTATLTGTTGADLFSGKETVAYMRDEAGAAYSLYADKFSEVTAYGGGGDDTAYLYGSVGSDTLTMSVGFSTMTRAGSTSTVANNFATVKGYAVEGGTDTATLTGTTGADTFTGQDDWGILKDSAGTSYFNYIRYFDEVYAEAGDTTSGNDTLDVSETAEVWDVDYLFDPGDLLDW